MTHDVLTEFKENIKRVKDLHSIYNIIKKNTVEILDISDILRAEIVLIVSALDCYIHNIVKVKMIEVFKGNIPETHSFKKFKIPLEEVKKALKNPASFTWLENEIITQHGWKSFQQSKKIEEVVALISEQKIWSEVGEKFKTEQDIIKNRLDLIVDRRNKIAHEADIDPSNTFEITRWPIDDLMVQEIIGFIEQLVYTLDDLLNTL